MATCERPSGERKVVLRLGDALDREGAPDALERVAGHLREVGPSGADVNEVVPSGGRRELDGEVGAPTVRFAGIG